MASRMVRIGTMAAAVMVTAAGSAFGAAKVASRNHPASDADVRQRLAALEANGAANADTGARLVSLAHEVSGLHDVVSADASSVTVVGRAPVTQALQAAQLTFQISAARATMKDSVAAVQADMWGVDGALRAVGIPASSIHNTWGGAYSVYQSSRVSVNASVVAVTTDVNGIDGLLTKVLQGRSGEVAFEGASFDIEENESAVDAARTTAVADAKATAARYANLVGKKLGSIVSIGDVQATPSGYDGSYVPYRQEQLAVTYQLV